MYFWDVLGLLSSVIRYLSRAKFYLVNFFLILLKPQMRLFTIQKYMWILMARIQYNSFIHMFIETKFVFITLFKCNHSHARKKSDKKYCCSQYLWLAITGPLWRYNNSRSAQVHWLSSYRSWMGFRTGVEAVEFTGVAARIVNLKEKNQSDEKLQCYVPLKFFAHWALDT